MTDRIDELLPRVDEETKAKLRAAIDGFLYRRPDVSRETAELAVIKAWTRTLDGQSSLLDAEVHLLWERLRRARPRCSATGRLARYAHDGQEGKRRPLHRLLWRLLLPPGLGPFYSEGPG